ncbi:hypothetical protein [Brevibacillus reuszeri]|uniref:hypothetical protein n=1 Tax=Brevibacillus reuszeri TaxID=54915 RepID=UPI0028A08EA6|nr:hypothetical protein [Brevibacillus reuszeri]
MKASIYLILATVTFLTSGIIYTAERAIAYYSWIGQMQAKTGSFPTEPELPSLVTNGYVLFFLAFSIFLVVLMFLDRKK